MADSYNARHLLSADPLKVEDIAAILRATASVEGEFDPHVVRLAQEVERVQWEMLGWKGRCEEARKERDDVASRYWTLQMHKVKGGPV